MAVLAEERRGATLVELSPAADPAPLGLAAFALTTFMLSGHNASFIPDVLWVGLALFYGGLIQLLAGMWEFRNRNVFGSTAFSTYGGFWLGLGGFVVLSEATKLGGTLKPADVNNGLAWFVLLSPFSIATCCCGRCASTSPCSASSSRCRSPRSCS
jgi:succinate-acetate transporter protein